MEGKDSGPFAGRNTASSVIVTLTVSAFVVCMLYIIYRQLHRMLRRHGADNNTLAPAVDLDQKPVLSDVYIERGKLEWEWHISKVGEPSQIAHPPFGCGPLPQLPALVFDVIMGVNEFICPTLQPLSTAVLDATPTAPRTQDRWQGSSTEEEDTLHLSTIIALPSQRKQGYLDGEEVGDWAIGITAIRCRGFTAST